jgi:TorA maturation chaperone TorD
MSSLPNQPDSTSTVADSDWSEAVGRAAMYGFLSRSLLFPTAEGYDSIGSELVPLLESFSCRSGELQVAFSDAVAAHDVGRDELRRAHSLLFTHIENQDCPVHESAYSPGDVFRRADVMADIAAFYRAHGLEAGGIEHERVDHIATEVEFMSFLARKEAYAIQHLGIDEREECRRSQRSFLGDHLACWAPGLASRVQLLADHRFFEAIGSLLAAWIEAEKQYLDVEAAADRSEPQPLPESDDGLCGVTDAGTPVQLGKAPA